MSTARRFLVVGIVTGVAVGVLVGAGLTQPGRAAATAPSAGPSVTSTGIAAAEPGALPGVTTGSAGAAASGAAIAYPYFAGAPGVAPDHTIVVTGVGHADLAADGSDRSVAQRRALATALADARAQADAIAASTGLSISGVLSVSALVSPDYGVVPLVVGGPGVPSCVSGAAAGGPGATGNTVVPQPVCPPAYTPSLSVSVTVGYRVT